MQDVIRRLRFEARGFRRRGKATRGTRYSREFRAEVVKVARTGRAEGLTVARIARDLGLRTQTLTRWLRHAPSSTLRPIQVVDQQSSAPVAATSLVLVVPGGCRVEGLDTDSVVRVLRSLA